MQQIQGRLDRFTTLSIAAALFASLLWVIAHKQPDTATIQIVSHALVSDPGTDSTLYMRMGDDAFHAPGHLIYRDLFFVQHQKFIYPPSALFLTEIFAWLERHGIPQTTTMRVATLGCWLGVLAVGIAFYSAQRGKVTAKELLCIAVLWLLFLPIAEALYRGQVQQFLTLLWGAAALLWCRKRHGWAGVALAISCIFKPQMALFLVWGVWRRQWRFTAALAGVLLCVEACAVAHFGLQNHLDYLKVLSFLSRHGETLIGNQSVNGAMNRLLNNGEPAFWKPTVYPPYRAAVYGASTVSAAVAVLVGLVLPGFASRGRRMWQGTTADFLFFGCLATIASPIVWEHHYSVFFFVLLYLLVRVERLTTLRWRLLLLTVLGMANRIMPLDHRQHGLPSLLGDYLFYAGLTMLWLLVVTEQTVEPARPGAKQGADSFSAPPVGA